MADKHTETYRKLCDKSREFQLLESLQEILEWDERTQLPAAGGIGSV